MPAVLSSHTGAAHELHVSAALLRAGYVVFRAVSPSSPFDLVVLDPTDNNIVRVEVSIARRRADGSLSFLRHQVEDADIVAGVLPDGSIRYALTSEAWR